MEVGDVQLGVEYNYTVLDEEVFSLVEGSENTITIIATDNLRAVTIVELTFIVVEDLVSTAIFYLLIKDNETENFYPIAKMEIDQYLDYMRLGVTSYKVRSVDKYDNFNDSNEVVLNIKINGGQLALTENPENMVPMLHRYESSPSRNVSASFNFTPVFYEGRQVPVLHNSGHEEKKLDLQLTYLDKSNKEKLEKILQTQGNLIYRDLFGTRIIGKGTSYAFNPISSKFGPNKALVAHYHLEVAESNYKEGIDYD